MIRLRLGVIFILLVVGLLMADHGTSQAQTPNPLHEPIDVILVLDDSGSMGPDYTPRSDVNGLRYAAARLLTELAGEGDRVAVVHFGTNAQIDEGCLQRGYNEAVDLSKCDLPEITDQNRDATLNMIQLPDELLGNTCMHLGLGLAYDILQAKQAGDRPQAVIFLTDGQLFTTECADEESSEAYLDQAINDLRRAGIVTFPILLGEGADDAVAEKLSTATGGRTFNAADAEELIPAFSTIYAALQPSRYAVTLETTGSDHNVTLTTTPAQTVTTINFVVKHDFWTDLQLGGQVLRPGTLPNGGTMTVREDRNRVGQPEFDIITLTGNPLVGTWSLNLVAGARQALAIVDARTAPTLRFPEGIHTFSPRYVSQRPDGYLIDPGAITDGQPANMTVSVSSGEAVDNGPSNFRRLSSQDAPFDINVKVGDEIDPLVLQRDYQIRPGDYPRLEVVSAIPGSSGTPAQFTVRWSDSSVATATSIETVIVDQTNSIVYRSTNFACDGSLCQLESFEQDAGRTYTAWFLGTAQTADGTLFNDYASAILTSEPLIQIRGLPTQIDLLDNPGPFPLEILVGAEQDPGQLTAVLFDSANNRAAGQPTLHLESNLIPGGRVRGELRFDDIAAISTSGFIGELRFATATTRVTPQSVATTYRPGVTLVVDGSINLTDSFGPYPISATLNGQGNPTSLVATLVDTRTNADIPIDVILSAPELLPGQTTVGDLRFALPPDMKAGTYTGKVVFETLDGTVVSPGAISVSLNLVPADVSLELPEQINFGYWMDPTTPITVPVDVQSNIGAVRLAANLAQMSPNAPLVPTLELATTSANTTLRTGTLALAMTEASDRLPSGEITGVVQFEVANALGGDVRPAERTFRLNRPSYWTQFMWCDPDYPVDPAPALQGAFCLFWPRQTLLNGLELFPRWHWWSLFRCLTTPLVMLLAFVFVRVRLNSPEDLGGGNEVYDPDDGPGQPPGLTPPPPGSSTDTTTSRGRTQNGRGQRQTQTRTTARASIRPATRSGTSTRSRTSPSNRSSTSTRPRTSRPRTR